MEEFKILSVGDPHIKISDMDQFKLFREALMVQVAKCQPNLIVIMGDLLDRFEIVHVLALNEAHSFIAELSSISPVYLLIGNHDLINNNTYLGKQHAFNSLKLWKDVRIIDKPTILNIEHLSFCFVPYTPPGKFIDALNTIGGWSVCTTIFSHQEFYGCKLGALLSDKGDTWPENYPMIVNGHIHDYCRVQKNILNIGASRYISFGETDKKTISLFTYKDMSVTEQRIDLGLPRRITYDVAAKDVKVLHIPDDVIARINISGTTEELIALKKTKEYRDLCEKTKTVLKPTDIIQSETNIERISYVELLQKACKGESELVLEALNEVLSAP